MSKKSAVWITGATSGIGKAIVERLNHEEKEIILSARTESKLNDLVDGNSFLHPFRMDVGSYDAISDTHNKIQKDFDIDVLINNAGVTRFKSVKDHTPEEVEEIINVNLLGAIHLTKKVLPDMIERKQGTIINVLSVVADKVFTNSSVYAASKAGLQAFAKVLREETRESNIRIINILPGATKTPIWPENAVAKFGNRMMEPTDIAEFISKILTDESTLVPEEVILRPITGDL